jgi:hypothetical protein
MTFSHQPGLEKLISRLQEDFGLEDLKLTPTTVEGLTGVALTTPSAYPAAVYLAAGSEADYFLALERPSDDDPTMPATRALQFEAGDFAEIAALIESHLRPAPGN